MRAGNLWRLGGVLALLASAAWADAAADLDAAISLYDLKKSEQAVRALRAVLASSDATGPVRARAHLYIALALSKLGENVGATASFIDAFTLDPLLPLPFGTRPEVVSRAEALRAETQAKIEARADLAEWNTPTEVPPQPPAPLPPADPAFPAPPLAVAEAPLPPVEVPVQPALPPAPAPAPIVQQAPREKPTNPDDGIHFGAGMRFLYNPLDELIGPGAEFSFGSQSGGRQLAVLLTLFPGRQWGVGAAARIMFGPVIKRWRIEFGFDFGAILYPSRMQGAFEVSTQVLGFSFPAGPVRVKIKLFNAAVYANLFSRPVVFIPALGAGFGVEY